MSMNPMAETPPSEYSCLPRSRGLFYAGDWHEPLSATYRETLNPANGLPVASVAHASADDAEAAIERAHEAWLDWRGTAPAKRQRMLHEAASLLREHAEEFAMIDAINTGNPVAEMVGDAMVAADSLDFFAGLVPMLKGETIPVDGNSLHYSLREPLGVVARIVAYNHPLMFAAGKVAAPLAAGNTVIVKPPPSRRRFPVCDLPKYSGTYFHLAS
ncbi:NAD/NADP-dependent betaine aldehyde dehydrogenase [Burkholderia multivorans]|nr:NAD/NADP-dependent betaine aldehyde dehydrogenase [Burkholderia multivorans]